MSAPVGSSDASSGKKIVRAAQVIVVSSVMLSFISYWRTAAVVLCDLASTAYYIGGIVEQSVGPAAPWFILAVMMFSYCVRSVYIESCSLFVRGGVYRVVKEAMGGLLAKLSVSALMFDYILTGPISGVSAGQYIMGLGIDIYRYTTGIDLTTMVAHGVGKDAVMWSVELKNWGAVVIACAATLYFFWENLKGIHESSDKAVKIMKATTVMAVIIMVWCGATLAVNGIAKYTVKDANGVETVKQNSLPMLPDLNPHLDYSKNPPEPESPLGFLKGTEMQKKLEEVTAPSAPANGWWSIFGFIGIAIAFGHSILAMSGEETLAQVYREVEAPKMVNFKKAAFVVFVYSMILTAGISFLAVLLIPEDVRMAKFSDNLISGLAMNVIGPEWSQLCLQGFVVFIGFLILSGAVNTAIIGSNGVLNRVSEDGVMPDWFLKPHKKYGTTYRILALVVGLQLFTIIYSGGDTLVLGEAYAFGVVWSFVFKALAMVVLRFKDRTPRDYKVPFNVRVGKYELPIGLGLIFFVLLVAAIMNLLTKQTATQWGLAFTGAFLTIFIATEQVHLRRRKGAHHDHQEHFNQDTTAEINPERLGIHLPYRKLVAIRSPQNLFMLEKALSESDPDTTDVIVMTSKVETSGVSDTSGDDLDHYDRVLMTAVVNKAETIGKHVIPIIVPTNNPFYAVLRTAKEIGAQELVIGASNKFTAEEQLDQISLYWINLCEGSPTPLTIRILSRTRDVTFDLEGGNRIPKITERQARTIAELRGAGVGVDRVLFAYEATPGGSDLFQQILTMLDPDVVLNLYVSGTAERANGTLTRDLEQAKRVGRTVEVIALPGNAGEELLRTAREGGYSLIILGHPVNAEQGSPWTPDVVEFLRRNAHCPVCPITLPSLPQGVET